MLPADHDRFSKLAQGLQGLVTSIAILVGGLWIAYTYVSLKTAEKAQVEFETAKARYPALDIEMKSQLLHNKCPGYKYFHTFIHTVVSIRNTGAREVRLDLSKPSLSVDQPIGEAGSQFKGSWGADPYGLWSRNDTVKAVVVRPGNRQELHYLSDFLEPGLYRIEFSAPGSETDSNAVVQPSHISGQPIPPPQSRWTSMHYAEFLRNDVPQCADGTRSNASRK